MNVEKKAFVSAIKRVYAGVDAGGSLLEGASSVTFDNGWVHSYNDSISVSAPIQELKEVNGDVKAKELFAIANKLKEDTVDVSTTDATLKLHAGKINVEMVLKKSDQKARISSVLEGITEWQDLPADFQEGLKSVLFANNPSPVGGVFVTANQMCSTDERRINLFTLSGEMGQFWINNLSAKELMNYTGFKFYAVSEKWVHFKTEEGTCFSVKKLFDEKYPYNHIVGLFEKVTPTKDDLTNTIPADLVESVQRASILHMEAEGKKAVQITISPKSIQVYSEHSAGKYSETVDWDYLFAEDFDPIDIFIDAATLDYAVSKASKFYVKFMDANEVKLTCLLFISEKFKHLVTTLRK